MGTKPEPGAEGAAAIEARRRLIAIALISGAFGCFAGLDACAKWLSPRIGVIETTFVRYTVSFILVTAILNPVTRPGILKTHRPWWQAARSLLLLLSTVLNFLALEHLQLAQTMTILFLQPLLVALLAGPLLGEWVGWRRFLAIFVGFLGVMVMIRPGFGGIHPAALYSFAGVFCYAGYSLITRSLAGHDRPATTMLYSAVAGVIILAPIMPFTWWARPEGLTIVIMVLIGLCGALGHWLLILAHDRAPASALAPFLYVQILWMTALGYFVFGDLPDRATALGGAIVIGSGLYLLHRERIRRVAV